jgi:hypothetical protein
VLGSGPYLPTRARDPLYITTRQNDALGHVVSAHISAFRVRRRDRNGQYALAPGCTSEASIEANYGVSDLREAFKPGRARPGSNAQSSS